MIACVSVLDHGRSTRMAIGQSLVELVRLIQHQPANSTKNSSSQPPLRGQSMLLNVRAAATYELAAESFMYLMVEPPLVGPSHRVEHELLVTTPTHFCELRRDLYGNLQRQLVGAAGDVHV